MAENGTEDFDVGVCSTEDLLDGQMKEVQVGSTKALLIKDCDGFYAIGNKCSHYGAQLVKGALGNGHVRCPWHGACFNYKTGDIEDFPGLDSVPKHQVIVQDKEVRILVKKSSTNKRQKAMVGADTSDKRSFVIVGGGGASTTCAETLRQEGFKGKITILSKEKNVAYDRPKLSKALSIKAEDIALRKQEFYEKYDIDYKTSTQVTSVDIKTNMVILEDGSRMAYDKLLLATGGSPRKCTFIKNHDLTNVHTLRTVEDANAIAEKAKGKNIIIIGTSFIGVEVAAALVKSAISVSLIGSSETPLQAALGRQVGNTFKKLLEEKGIKCYFKNSVTEFVGENGALSKVVLKDGKILDADLCITGIGVVPATQFLTASDFDMTDKGYVTVNKCMKTSRDNVFAAGDITHFPLFMAQDEHVNIQHWQMANQQGRIAALNMLGKHTEIKSVPYFWMVIFGKSLRYCGYSAGYDNVIIHGKLEELKFVAYYMKNDNVIAVASMGCDPVVSQAAEMFLTGQPITEDLIKTCTPDLLYEATQKDSVSTNPITNKECSTCVVL